MGTSGLGLDGGVFLCFQVAAEHRMSPGFVRICLRMVIRMRWSHVCMHLGEFPEHSDPGQVHVNTTELKMQPFVVV